ncbi:hypothetical protein [Streptomyces sp. NBC_00009]|uniref:DinB/UmuC family translesion DNA polymerase n=1 Tax=Streptomyces sp. NBC_00009 TaxID=2975620 RepID=UPI003866BFEB
MVRSTSTSHTFEADELDPAAHRRELLALADELGARLRATDEVCRGLTLTVRYADRTHTTRSLPEPKTHRHRPSRIRSRGTGATEREHPTP